MSTTILYIIDEFLLNYLVEKKHYSGFNNVDSKRMVYFRPGARRESLDHYLKRLKALEDIANSFKGVEKSYAIQAGREIRILVKPEEIDDLGAMRIARDIVKKIEEGLEFPGQIKVTVLRETRAVDYAK